MATLPIEWYAFSIHAMNKEEIQKLFLRLAGVFEILAFFAVVMPRSWMEMSHEWLGLGPMPVSPVLIFLARQASYTYGMHGVSLLVLASDVKRFRPLVIVNGIAYLLGAPIFAAIDYTSNMPWWWTIADPVGCGFLGALLLWSSFGTEPANARVEHA